jgi:cysteine desulfurase/selenocysteine lyase
MKAITDIRADFPLLKRTIRDKRIVYLDSTASSLKPQSVIDAINEYYTQYSVNIFRGVYKLSEEATAKYEESREIIGEFIGAKTGLEVVFVRNATEALNLVATCWGLENIKDGDVIVSTVMEHHANIVPWQEVCRKKNAQLKYFDITDDGELDLSLFDKTVTERTKLVALTMVSNVLGTINPIKELISRIKKVNPEIIVVVDGAQAVPHMSVNVQELGCDFFVFSGHKMLGPTGIGVLWGKEELLNSMPPYQFGGEMIAEVHLHVSRYQAAPHRFEAGTPHISGAMGLAAAVKYHQSLGMDAIRTHEKELTAYALERFKELPLRVIGTKDPEKRGGVISFTFDGIHPHDLGQILDFYNICIRTGHHCAMPLHERFNIVASARASFYIYNDKDDVDALIEGLKQSRKVFGLT